MKLSAQLYEEIFKSMPLGLILLNENQEILAWNAWMKSKTNLEEQAVLGKTLATLYPSENYVRFDWACNQIFSFGAPQVLSQTLNQYLVPISLEGEGFENITKMQQHVEILPLEHASSWLGLIIIQDVTNAVAQKSLLMEMGHKLEEESYRDALTGIYNRRFLWEYLEQQILQAKRTKSMIGSVMLDLDHFKKINDQYGHETGDRVLVAFVNLVNRLIRASDVFVRYGGEEFILLLLDAKLDDVKRLADAIRVAFEKESASLFDGTPVTCSLGIALWHYENPSTPQILIDQADKALYAAKNSGRNCLKYYGDLEE